MSMSGHPMVQYRSLMRDGSVPRRLAPGTTRRIVGFARPYRKLIIAFLVTVVLDAMTVVVTPLLFKVIIDQGVAKGSTTVVMWTAAGVAGLAVFDTILTLIGRYYSSRIGEGLIYDLRTKVFDHVQRMPLAFFTGRRPARSCRGSTATWSARSRRSRRRCRRSCPTWCRSYSCSGR